MIRILRTAREALDGCDAKTLSPRAVAALLNAIRVQRTVLQKVNGCGRRRMVEKSRLAASAPGGLVGANSAMIGPSLMTTSRAELTEALGIMRRERWDCARRLQQAKAMREAMTADLLRASIRDRLIEPQSPPRSWLSYGRSTPAASAAAAVGPISSTPQNRPASGHGDGHRRDRLPLLLAPPHGKAAADDDDDAERRIAARHVAPDHQPRSPGPDDRGVGQRRHGRGIGQLQAP